MKAFLFLSLGILFLSGCSSDKARISGRLGECCTEQMLYLDKLLPGNSQTVDSVKLDDDYSFRLEIKMPDRQPVFYNLRYDGAIIPLIVKPGEKIKINSIGDIAYNYMVEGSKESERMKELHALFLEGVNSLSQIWDRWSKTRVDQRMDVMVEYQNEYKRIKATQLKYITEDPGSFSSLYALDLRLPGETYLTRDGNDIEYYELVADALEKSNPDSPYVVALKKQIEKAYRVTGLKEKLNDASQSGNNIIDISLPDIYGDKHTLSDIKDKIILIDFWLSSSRDSRLNNAELKNIYSELSPKGFEVYQVAADVKKADWVIAVQDQKLPWISVSDLKGDASPVLRRYNVTVIPSNFLLNKSGEIIARDIYGEALEELLKQQLN